MVAVQTQRLDQPGAVWDLRETDPVWLVTMAVLGAALSLLITGYNFGENNNLFHLPILEQLYDEPQFKADVFTQSLRFYAAGPFILLEGSSRYISPRTTFAILIFFSRFLTVFGLLLCATQLGIGSRTSRLIFTVLVSFASLLRGYSFAGAGGLFINTFTHSEIANGLLLISLYFATGGRIATAFVFNGLVFFINAFMAVWAAIPLGLIILLCLRKHEITIGQALRRGALGMIGFIVLAAPVLRNILANPEFGHPIGFDYPTFLRGYFPLHFLFAEFSFQDVVKLGVVVSIGILGFYALGRRATKLYAAFWGFAIVYAVGIVVPWITSSPTVLNLHLLRSSVGLHLLAGLAAVVTMMNWLRSTEPRLAAFYGPLLVVTFCSFRFAVIAAPLVMAAGLFAPLPGRLLASLRHNRRVVVAVTAAVLLLIWTLQVMLIRQADAQFDARSEWWRAVGEWARRSTDPETVFLVPTSRLSGEAQHTIGSGSVLFQAISHRREWVTFKSGAAAMWFPSYYPIWRQRVQEQLEAVDLSAKLAYADKHGIGFVIDACGSDAVVSPVFQAGNVCVYPVRPVASPSAKKG